MCTEREMDTVAAAEKQVVAANDTSTPLDLLRMEGQHIGHCRCPTVIVTTEGASVHASPDPLLTQKHVWQSVAGDSFVPTFSRKTPLHHQPLDWSSLVGRVWVFMCLSKLGICLFVCFQPHSGQMKFIWWHETAETASRIVADVGLGWKNGCVSLGVGLDKRNIFVVIVAITLTVCILIWIMSGWGCSASDAETARRCQGVFPKILEKDWVKHWTTSNASFERKWESWV